MNFLSIFGFENPREETLPPFIKSVQESQGVVILRLQGPVGKEIGAQVQLAEEVAAQEELATRPMLIDFKETTEWDFSTISYLILTLRKHLAAGTNIGIINPSSRLVAELEVAKVESMFRVFTSESEALAALSSIEPHPLQKST